MTPRRRSRSHRVRGMSESTLAKHIRLAGGLAVSVVCIAAGVGCDAGKYPYDTPPSGLRGEQAVALFRREVERRALTGRFPMSEKVETQTPSGTDAWLVRLSSQDASRDLCGYVWRGERAGMADATYIRFRFDAGCRHWRE
jgi:hypothetical protein